MKIFKCFKKQKGKETYNIPPIETIDGSFSEFEYTIMLLINQERNKAGLHELLYHHFSLRDIAYSHSYNMVNKGKAGHDGFPIRDAQARVYCKAGWLGECVSYGYGTARGVVDGLMKSEGHRAILEKQKADRMAVVALKDSKGRNYITLLFID